MRISYLLGTDWNTYFYRMGKKNLGNVKLKEFRDLLKFWQTTKLRLLRQKEFGKSWFWFWITWVIVERKYSWELYLLETNSNSYLYQVSKITWLLKFKTLYKSCKSKMLPKFWILWAEFLISYKCISRSLHSFYWWRFICFWSNYLKLHLCLLPCIQFC